MAATALLLLLLSAATPAGADSTAAADSVGPHRVVRRLPPVEVRAPAQDLRATQTTHAIGERALATLPLSELADVVLLQPGVVAQAGELHVRGGRAGETGQALDGFPLVDPLNHRTLGLPLAALREAELVEGAPDGRYGGALAGVLDLHALAPTPRLAGLWRWEGDGGRDTRYDRLQGRLAGPVARTGLGALAAADLVFDDTALPALRTRSVHRVAGFDLGWRAENRMNAFAELTSLAHPGRAVLQLAAARAVHEPYDPQWTLDGWTSIPADPKSLPVFNPTPVAGALRWHAADHLTITDERQLAGTLAFASGPGPRRSAVRAGWLRTRSVTAVGGTPGAGRHQAIFDDNPGLDPFHVLWGDDPFESESGSDVLSLEGRADLDTRRGATLGFGAGASYEQVWLREVNGAPRTWVSGDVGTSGVPIDSLRAFRAYAPGAWAWAQGRWSIGTMVVNAALRAELFVPGPQARRQTLPGGDPVPTLSPRLGIAYPLTLRDAFSFAYARLVQAPDRVLLYDTRTTVTNREPLGNPALTPSTVISYEAAVKHLFDAAWSLQGALFFRDLFDQVGVRDYTLPGGPVDLRYTNDDWGHAAGFEWTLVRTGGGGPELQFAYTWMEAWGNESRSIGDPYGSERSARSAPIADRPLSWDRRHTLLLAGSWRWRSRAQVAWATRVGSPLPWTPKPFRAPLTDPAAVNSARLGWTENTDLDLRWAPPRAFGIELTLSVRNLFDGRSERLVTVDGYPNPVVNTIYDDDSAYRTATGLGGGGYWSAGANGAPGQWVAVHDPRLFDPPRTIRIGLGRAW